MTPVSESQRARFCIYKKQKYKTLIYIQKARHFAKIRTICVTFLFTKIHTLYLTQFFHEFLKLAFVYIKKAWHFSFCDVLYRKIHTLRKKQDNLRYVFLCTKSLTLCVAQFFMEFLKLAEGGAFLWNFALHFYIQKTIHYPLRFI